ncbi:MAG: RNA 2',3'-cyclic phosphodiesterase [Candidatus Hydrogenedentes bacterium]|nr:RNA 2',3'-cyclic phosphodiesterase [Candidatus Hydrogenedentota bacterium]
MRCFLAIELPSGVIHRLSQLSAQLRRCPVKASWVRPEHMHLTLRFLGDIDNRQSTSISDALRDAFIEIRPFTLLAQAAGAFPNLRLPSVVWAGIGPLTGPLETVQAHCERAGQHAGLLPESKPFHPHITLARIKDRHPPVDLMHVIERERNFTAGEFTVRGVSLFKSELTPRGPNYTRLEEILFA